MRLAELQWETVLGQSDPQIISCVSSHRYKVTQTLKAVFPDVKFIFQRLSGLMVVEVVVVVTGPGGEASPPGEESIMSSVRKTASSTLQPNPT